MPNLPISQLPAAGSLTGAELFAVVQGGVTKYTTAQNLNYITSNNYGLFNQTGSSIPVTNTTDEMVLQLEMLSMLFYQDGLVQQIIILFKFGLKLMVLY